MMLRYSVIRAGDPLRGEWVNIGIVAQCGDVIDFRLIRDTSRAVAFEGNWIVKHLPELAAALNELQDYQDVVTLDRMVREWAGSITFTPWRCSMAATAYRFCEEWAADFLVERHADTVLRHLASQCPSMGNCADCLHNAPDVAAVDVDCIEVRIALERILSECAIIDCEVGEDAQRSCVQAPTAEVVSNSTKDVRKTVAKLCDLLGVRLRDAQSFAEFLKPHAFPDVLGLLYPKDRAQ